MQKIYKIIVTHMGKRPTNPTVTKFCMWVPFPDIINYVRFYLYRPNRFWGPDPKICIFQLT